MSKIAILGENPEAGTVLLGLGNGGQQNISAQSLKGTYNQQVQAIAKLAQDPEVDVSCLDVEDTVHHINSQVENLYGDLTT